MGAYIVRRLLLMIPTLLAIMVINFVIIPVSYTHLTLPTKA